MAARSGTTAGVDIAGFSQNPSQRRSVSEELRQFLGVKRFQAQNYQRTATF